MWGLLLPLLLRTVCPLQPFPFSSIQAAADAAKRWESQGEWEQAARALEQLAGETQDAAERRRVLKRAAWIRSDRLHDASAARRIWTLLWEEAEGTEALTGEERLSRADLAWLAGERNLAAEILFSLVSSNSGGEADPALAAGARLMDRGLAGPHQLDALAEALIQGGIPPSPSGEAFLCLYGTALLETGQSSRAAEALEAQMRLYPEIDSAWNRSGGLLLGMLRDQGDKARMRETWKEMWSHCKDKPMGPAILADLALLLGESVSPRIAIKLVERSLKEAQGPADRAAPLWVQVQLLEASRDWAGALNALADLEESVRLAPAAAVPSLVWSAKENQAHLIRDRLESLCESGWLAEPASFELPSEPLAAEPLEASCPLSETSLDEPRSRTVRQLLSADSDEVLCLFQEGLLGLVRIDTGQARTVRSPWSPFRAAACLPGDKHTILFVCEEGVGRLSLKEEKAQLWTVPSPAWKEPSPCLLLVSGQGTAAAQSGSAVLLQDANRVWHRTSTRDARLLTGDTQGRFWAMDREGLIALGVPWGQAQRWIQLPRGMDPAGSLTGAVLDEQDTLWLLGPFHDVLGLRLPNRAVVAPPPIHPSRPFLQTAPPAGQAPSAVSQAGGLWVWEEKGLFRFSPNTRRWTRYKVPGKGHPHRIRDLRTGGDRDTLWLASSEGVYSFQQDTGAWRVLF